MKLKMLILLEHVFGNLWWCLDTICQRLQAPSWIPEPLWWLHNFTAMLRLRLMMPDWKFKWTRCGIAMVEISI